MFETSKIPFCGKQACNVVDDSFKAELLEILQKNYYISIKDRNFYIINQKNVKYIEKDPNILSVKSSGSLYYLFLTQIDGDNFCFFIDKKIKEGHSCPRIISVNYRFDDELYKNTLFEGELLRDNDQNWLYIINNLILHQGKLMKDKHINHKINLVYDILTNKYIRDTHLEICPLYVKRLFANHEFDHMVKTYIPSLNYNCRGIYFEGIRNLKNHLYLFPRNHKFKKIETAPKKEEQPKIVKRVNVKNKVDLENRKYIRLMMEKGETSDIYNLYCFDNDEIHNCGGAHIQNLRTSKYMRKCFQNGEDNITMNCEYNPSMEKWKPIEKTNDPVDDLSSIEHFKNNYF
jgi:hypothetical protein